MGRRSLLGLGSFSLYLPLSTPWSPEPLQFPARPLLWVRLIDRARKQLQSGPQVLQPTEPPHYDSYSCGCALFMATQLIDSRP